jgi:hypothetical protein
MRRRALLAAALATALPACGGGDAERLRRESVEALRAGDAVAATRLADEAAAKGGEAYAGHRAFVRGNAAFAASEAAEAEAARPGGDERALEGAVAAAEDAVASWGVAAASRADWPEAGRNVERGLLRLARLRGLAATKAGARPPPGNGDPPASKPPDRATGTPPPPPGPKPGTGEAEAPTEAGPAPLPPERVLGLLDVLREKEREKAALRRARRAAAGTASGKDW